MILQTIKNFFAMFLEKEKQIRFYVLEHRCGSQTVNDVSSFYPNNPDKQFECLACNCITSTGVKKIIVDGNDPLIISAAEKGQLFLYTETKEQ